jgi:hypothetical protein
MLGQASFLVLIGLFPPLAAFQAVTDALLRSCYHLSGGSTDSKHARTDGFPVHPRSFPPYLLHLMLTDPL